MHPQWPPLSIGGTVLRGSDDLVILGVTLIPRWLLRSIFALFTEQLLNGLVSLGSPGKYSMRDYFLGDASGVFSCTFWNNALWCGTRLPILTLKLTTGPRSRWCQFFQLGCVLVWPCTCRSVAVSCMMYKIRCNPLHPFYGALPVPYVPVRVTRGTVVAHWYTYAPSRCRTSQYSRTSIPFSVSLCNDLIVTPYFMVWDCMAGFKTEANAFLLA